MPPSSPLAALRRLVALSLLALSLLAPALFFAGAGPASAHDGLESSTPAAGASVTAPTRVVLRFSDRVLPDFTRLRLTSPGGATADIPTTTSGDTVTGTLPADPAAGGWTVTWRIASADGHPVSGTLPFTVTAARTATPTLTTQTMTTPTGTTPTVTTPTVTTPVVTSTPVPTRDPTLTAAAVAPASSGSRVVPAVLTVIAVAVLALLAVLVRRARRQARG